MSISLVSNQKITETSSKGNQEKWYDAGTNSWYKLDQLQSNIKCNDLFTFLHYHK